MYFMLTFSVSVRLFKFTGLNNLLTYFSFYVLGAETTRDSDTCSTYQPVFSVTVFFSAFFTVEGSLGDRRYFLSTIVRVLSINPKVDVVIITDDFQLLVKTCAVVFLIVSLRLLYLLLGRLYRLMNSGLPFSVEVTFRLFE